jgi:transcriptional regulator with XRE-family HTH domain
MTNFSKILKQIMHDRGLTQSQLSKLIDIRQSQISNWLAGRSLPNYYSLEILSTALSTPIQDFFPAPQPQRSAL